MIMWSALPEEILKYLSIAFFSYRSYIADPESMMSISLPGAGFVLVENILYIVEGSSNIMISLIRIILPFPLHVLCQMINGVHLAKRKFVYRETGLNAIVNAQVNFHGGISLHIHLLFMLYIMDSLH